MARTPCSGFLPREFVKCLLRQGARYHQLVQQLGGAREQRDGAAVFTTQLSAMQSQALSAPLPYSAVMSPASW